MSGKPDDVIGDPVGVVSTQGHALRGLVCSNCRIGFACGRGVGDQFVAPFLWCEGLVAHAEPAIQEGAKSPNEFLIWPSSRTCRP